MKLEGAAIVISGGSGYLGRGISGYLRAKGAVTIVLDKEPQEIPGDLEGGFHHEFADLSDHVETSEAFERIARRFSRIVGLVNCVGMIHSEAFAQFSSSGPRMHNPEAFRKVFESNLTTVFNASSAFVKLMISRRHRGSIVNLSSISSAGNPGQVAYSSAKAAVEALTVSLASELGPQGMRVNAVVPGFIDTGSTKQAMTLESLDRIARLTPLRRLGGVENVAHMVCACLENEFLNGALIPISGGLRF
jgi:3-oxoacyl-[acyl-carrier protein] reductase